MKNVNRIVCIPLWLCMWCSLGAQSAWNLALGADVGKEFKINQAHRINVQGRLTLNPRFKDLDRDYNELWQELDLVPLRGTDDDDNDDDDEDDDDDDNNGGGGNSSTPPALNDQPRRLDLGLRTAAAVGWQWRFSKTLRASAEYTLFWFPGDFRHGWEWELAHQPKLFSKRWRISSRVGLQHLGRTRRDRFEVAHGIYSRFSSSYTFKDEHQLYADLACNAEWDDGHLEADRLRMEWGVRYAFQEHHRFRLGFRHQLGLNRLEWAHGLRFSYSIDL